MSAMTSGSNRFAAEIFDHQGRLRVIPEDRWSVYVAFAKDGAVKVGVTHRPMMRMCEVHKTQRPIKQYLCAQVDSKSNAYGIESSLKRAFAARHIEGEWFRFDYRLAEDKAEFHAITKAVFRAVEQRDLVWSHGDMAQVLAYLAMDQALATDAKGKGRVKPKRWGATRMTPT